MLHHKKAVGALFVLTLLFVAACEHRSPADKLMNDPAAIARGKSIYTGNCGGYCHSRGPRDAPNLFDCNWIHGGSDEEIFHTISNGVKGTRMPSWAGKLPRGDKDIWNVIAYLKKNRQACPNGS